MNKKEFLDYLSLKTNLSKTKCDFVLSQIRAIIFENLKVGEQIKFNGFGKFFVKYQKEKLCKCSEGLKLLPAKNIAKFVASKGLKNIVR